MTTDGAFNFAASTKALRHPLIVQTRQALREGSLDDRRILRPKYQARSLNVRVGKDSVKRALELLASMIATAERHDAQIAVSQGDRQWETSFVAFGQSISFSISEKAHHRILDSPPEQRPGHYVRIIMLRGKPIEYVPTGKLTLSIEFYGTELRTSWTEGEHNLDELLPEIISNLFKAAVLRRRDRLKQAAEAEARLRKEIELRQLRHRIEEEERRVKDLQQVSLQDRCRSSLQGRSIACLSKAVKPSA